MNNPYIIYNKDIRLINSYHIDNIIREFYHHYRNGHYSNNNYSDMLFKTQIDNMSKLLKCGYFDNRWLIYASNDSSIGTVEYECTTALICLFRPDYG